MSRIQVYPETNSPRAHFRRTQVAPKPREPLLTFTGPEATTLDEVNERYQQYKDCLQDYLDNPLAPCVLRTSTCIAGATATGCVLGNPIIGTFSMTLSLIVCSGVNLAYELNHTYTFR